MERETTIFWPFALLPGGRVYARGVLADGLREGRWVFWRRSGKVEMEGVYSGGVRQGVWRKWWENGNLASEGAFLNGKMHGEWKDDYPEGGLAQKSFWHHGRRSGAWETYDREGRLKGSQTFDSATEKDLGYSLLTDREARELVHREQRRLIRKRWTNLVGARAARYLEPWHIALWVLVFIPVLAFLKPQAGALAIPAGAVGATLLSAGIVLWLAWRDTYIRPGIGLPEDR
jgi:hypothetical protein